MASTYLGNPTDTMYRSSFQLLTSKDHYETEVRWACFNKTDFTKAVGVEAFGVPAMTSPEKFGSAKPTGRIIEVRTGGYAMSGSIWAETGSSYHTGRMGTHTPQLVEGGDEWSYAWHQLNATRYIPQNDVEDNSGGHINIQALREDEMKQQFVTDFNYCLLGNSSAPDTGVMGPSTVYSDLPNLLSVTQSRTVGGIAKTASKWQNGTKAITSIGSAGDFDLPIQLERSLKSGLLGRAQYAEATMDYMMLATPGAWLYYDRIKTADVHQAGISGAAVVNKKYDAAGIMHYTLLGQSMIFDQAVTVPYGATASTEAIYGIHIPSFFISIRSEKNFKFSGWEAPRVHDATKAEVAWLTLRYTPGVRAMRPHIVFYNIPDNGDI